VTVAVVARDPAGIDAAVGALQGDGRRVLGVPADTADDQAVAQMVSRVVYEFGGVDILVNCAARRGTSGQNSALAGFDVGEFRLDIETKVLGYLRCARAVVPYMVEQHWGRIINIGGTGARRTGHLATSIRNVSVAALTKNLADELGPSGVNVTVVHPGMTYIEPRTAEERESDEQDREARAARAASEVGIGRTVTATEIADVVTFLASPRSVAINGDPVVVAGGMRSVIYY
jgi:NAD(P)-dependent dehydrogenase (short-subunit alcohol dehydrogenase family)